MRKPFPLGACTLYGRPLTLLSVFISLYLLVSTSETFAPTLSIFKAGRRFYKRALLLVLYAWTLLLPARNTSWRIDNFGQLLFLNLFCLVFESYCCYCLSYCHHASRISLYHLKMLPPSLNTMLMYFNKSLLLSQGSKGGTCPPRLCSNSCIKWM